MVTASYTPCCMPRLFDHSNMHFQKVENVIYNFELKKNFKSSPSYQSRMFNVPPKPHVLSTDYSLLNYFAPIEILGRNITSDDGLLHVLHHLDKWVCQHYVGRLYLKLDINIFPRFYKFAMASSEFSLHLRKRFVAFLSPWHLFKHCQLVLFRVWVWVGIKPKPFKF